ncbi:hypothetical protein [Paenibacillus sp. 32O-W]|uniref:hypothetical protein n=1 Tax=Paenibacillus sp. 32O-W TaxID=1695218 RepID=UPI0011AA5473|nr:hypothetical protein [Paenibacillus sp. 32O-W]
MRQNERAVVMFFFFFDDDRVKYQPGTVCRVVGRDEGKTVVIHQISEDTLWCYENRPVRHRINRQGVKVIDFDPACILSPYGYDVLEITNEIPLQTDGWGAKYRRQG